ncbi:MAG: class I SAM-dependent methyltransferase [Limosilactobacillus sp.]|uniref:class I SAM-dependent DNA methyltransferase n=1 Tax=Limosilactobacillus sp. TaxID=2773925 RepID=UPI002708EF20|nr:class I SAM-dependent methyltransferase [Limosilactobacillus sp.]
MIYQNFAQLYDELFDDELYQEWCDYTTNQLTPGCETVLDLAGGAGRLACLMAKKGYQVTVADFSDDMLALAEQHAEENGVELNLLNADMRDLSGLPQYDAVTCYADSFCYLDDIDDLKTAFTQVYEHLKDGGVFLFDMITPYKTDVVYPGYMFNYEDENHERAFMWQSFADDDVPGGVIHELTFFNQLPDGNYQRVSETHFERSFALEEIADAITEAGFKGLNVTADYGKSDPQDDTERWFFKCEK